MANQQAIDYIVKQKSLGVSNEAISASFIATGWKQSDIDDAFKALLNTVPETQLTMHPEVRYWKVATFIFGAITAIFIALMIIGIYAGDSRIKVKEVDYSKVVATSSEPIASSNVDNFVISDNTLSIKKDGNVIQVISLTQDATDALKVVGSYNFHKFIVNQDANFDGYNDIGVFSETGYGGVNNYYDYYIYNPKTGKYDKSTTLIGVSNPNIDTVNKQIISSYRSGPNWYQKTYKFNGVDFIVSAEYLEVGMIE